MQRKPLIAGNWKMHLSIPEAVILAEKVAESCRGLNDREVMIAPPATAIGAVSAAVNDSPLIVGAQNVAWGKEGAYTGEISPVMLKDIGASMAIVGHSERRHIFFESNNLIHHRVVGALAHGIIPVLCVGETLDEREQGQTFEVVEQQVSEGLADIVMEQVARIVIAYEPVWAIGTGKTAGREQAQEVHSFIRNLMADIYEKELAEHIRILYGGSVKPDNVDELMTMADIDGALVGGAALQAESFNRIIHFI